MSISAVNCTPIKPNASFGSKEKYEQINDSLEKLNEQYVKASDIKRPAAVGASVALAALTTYAGARGITNFATSKLAPRAGEVVETHLKSAADKVKNKAQELIGTPKEETLSSVKQFAGKAVEKLEAGARSIYKTVAYSGISKELQNPDRARKALGNVVGTGAAVAATADICTIDSNDDGVSDILQKSQNVYTGAKTTFQNAFDTVSVISEVAQVLA